MAPAASSFSRVVSPLWSGLFSVWFLSWERGRMGRLIRKSMSALDERLDVLSHGREKLSEESAAVILELTKDALYQLFVKKAKIE